MYALVLVGLAALRSAHAGNNQATDGELLTAAFAATDADETANDHMKETIKSSKGNPRRIFNAAIWCLRNGKTDFSLGWAAIGQNASQLDPTAKTQFSSALTP